MQLEQKKRADERKRESVKILEQIVRQEIDVEREKKDDRLDLDAVNTDDENEELAYEEWKLRELKRIKRDRDERESYEKEKAEIEKVHNMTEEERKAWMRANPRVVTNKVFMQLKKYCIMNEFKQLPSKIGIEKFSNHLHINADFFSIY